MKLHEGIFLLYCPAVQCITHWPLGDGVIIKKKKKPAVSQHMLWVHEYLSCPPHNEDVFFFFFFFFFWGGGVIDFTPSICLSNCPSVMQCLLCGLLPISWIILICGTNTTYEGRCVTYHLQVNRSRSKVKVIKRSLKFSAMSSPWMGDSLADLLHMWHLYNPWVNNVSYIIFSWMSDNRVTYNVEINELFASVARAWCHQPTNH